MPAGLVAGANRPRRGPAVHPIPGAAEAAGGMLVRFIRVYWVILIINLIMFVGRKRADWFGSSFFVPFTSRT
ncbi:hypothetical protein DLM85_19320 [Hymenobacter edaphi]|uniref:Uncharacterized protein n=1 Tax=Hymenobacter edaphi TaxID=2211146 RepID=A0A328B9U3_9BACT|nr:hypothetical protein DLM85_19320 [Hymenobacter edaphi]